MKKYPNNGPTLADQRDYCNYWINPVRAKRLGEKFAEMRNGKKGGQS